MVSNLLNLALQNINNAIMKKIAEPDKRTVKNSVNNIPVIQAAAGELKCAPRHGALAHKCKFFN